MSLKSVIIHMALLLKLNIVENKDSTKQIRAVVCTVCEILSGIRAFDICQYLFIIPFNISCLAVSPNKKCAGLFGLIGSSNVSSAFFFFFFFFKELEIKFTKKNYFYS
jgi:hypothetical protein